jgi:hypothetical protein
VLAQGSIDRESPVARILTASLRTVSEAGEREEFGRPKTSQGTTSSKVAGEVVRRSRAPATPPARATGSQAELRRDSSPICRRKPAAEATYTGQIPIVFVMRAVRAG